jgi:metal-sulfur cluster biosynthetic enzyme
VQRNEGLWKLITEFQARESVKAALDPGLGPNLIAMGIIRDLDTGDTEVRHAATLTTLVCPLQDRLRSGAEAPVPPPDGTIVEHTDLLR